MFRLPFSRDPVRADAADKVRAAGDSIRCIVEPLEQRALLAGSGLSGAYFNNVDLTGKVMTGWVLVEPSALEDDADLERWVRQGMEFAQSLPPK